MKNFAVVRNPLKDRNNKMTARVIDYMADRGARCALVTDVSDMEDDTEAVIVLGGDGTLLRASKMVVERQLPLLGINLGTMGFMTSLEPEDLPLILKAAKGEYRQSRRMMIDITLHRGDEVIYEGCALNDAYIHGYGDTIILHAMCDGQTITSFSGDGIIFSTPTGSTGYSLSAGGPVVEPETDNIIVTPICAHTMVSRTFVLGPERVASVTATRLHDRRAYLSVDGYVSADIRKDDVLTVKRSRRKVIFADLGAKSFYENTYEKLT
jgi:NAD+ kinase